MKIGYARVSSAGQSLDVQLEALRGAGCDRIRQEKQSAKTMNGRAELERALEDLRAGDQLVVTRLDRLARSVPDLYDIVRRIDGAGASFACLQQGGVDTSSPTGKLLLGMLGVVAEFENDLRRDRQLEGIARAKLEGKYRGPTPTIDPARVREAFERLGGAAAARELGISRPSVYRVLKQAATSAELAAAS